MPNWKEVLKEIQKVRVMIRLFCRHKGKVFIDYTIEGTICTNRYKCPRCNNIIVEYTDSCKR